MQLLKSFHSEVKICSWKFIVLILLTFTFHAQANTAANVADIESGRKIYVDGILPSGEPLKGLRLGAEVEGSAVSCEKCHRLSGLGGLEAGIVAPPITGLFLFSKGEEIPVALVDARSPKNITRAHKPYTDESIANAIRDGINVNGNLMSPLMPRYSLSNKEIKALISYLKQLSTDLSPGISSDKIRFATIIAPGVDRSQRDVVVSMIRKAFSQRNINQQMATGHMRMPLDLIPHTLRNWELSAWELQGAPETWGAQLADKYKREPVFAVMSGLSNSTWAPVHDFCEHEKLPCILPTIPLAPAQTGYYSLYYSRGVLLEAEVLARYLRDQAKKPFEKIVQIYRDTEVGIGATKELNHSLEGSGIQVESRVLTGKASNDFKKIFKGLSANDGLMLWLSADDLLALNKATPKLPSVTYVSGFLAEEKYKDFSKTWKSKIRLVYPYELGKKRDNNVAALKNWLRTRRLPLINEALQTEVYFNLLFFTDLSMQMIDNLYRDYFIERAEDMISWGSNNSIYPRLSLGRSQRFASKGAYIVHFDKSGQLAPETEWIIP